MNIDLNKDEMILILACLGATEFGEDESEAVDLRRQLITKIFLAMGPVNPSD